MRNSGEPFGSLGRELPRGAFHASLREVERKRVLSRPSGDCQRIAEGVFFHERGISGAKKGAKTVRGEGFQGKFSGVRGAKTVRGGAFRGVLWREERRDILRGVHGSCRRRGCC